MLTTNPNSCDFHIHSIFSDSDASLESIFKKAKDANLAAISLTDHDTVDGIDSALTLGKINNIEVIEGIEVSSQKADIEIHVLGFFVDSKSKVLKDALVNVKELRKERLAAMVDKLNRVGIAISKDELFASIKSAIPTRLHLGLHLVEKGVVKTLIEAFRQYLSPGKPGYVARFKYTVKEAIELIHSAGGLAFLAHPQMLADQKWIEEFIKDGLDGLEVVYPRLTKTKSLFYQDLADKHGLLKSGGSDAHGTYKEFTNVGGVTIPYEWVLAMKKRLNKI